MPIYEFYCADCHTIYNFLSRSVETRKRPACPRCGRRRLERRASAFAISSGRAERHDEELPAGFDESRLEQAMEALSREAEGVGEDDPQGMAGLMRRFYDGAGMQLGDGMQEALRRLEAGEDPDRIEDDLGDVLEQEDGESATLSARLRRRMRRPQVDPTLYEM